jgi:hypothetical protein
MPGDGEIGRPNQKRLSRNFGDSLWNHKVFGHRYEITGRIIHMTLLPPPARYEEKAPVFAPLKAMPPSPSI